MTVDASRSCLGLATSVGSAIRQIVVSRVAKPPEDAVAISSAKPSLPKLSSQRTLRWREMDSNFRFRVPCRGPKAIIAGFGCLPRSLDYLGLPRWTLQKARQSEVSEPRKPW